MTHKAGNSAVGVPEGTSAAAQNQALALSVFHILNRSDELRNLAREILAAIRKSLDFDAAAMRLRDGDDFTYYASDGFVDGFSAAERSLCMRDASGAVVTDATGCTILECLCGAVAQGLTNPSQTFFTPGGSFWTNNCSAFAASDPGSLRGMHLRGRCPREGYETLVLIPLRATDGEILGLLQLNDRRGGRLTPELVGFLESLGAAIGVAVRRRQNRDNLLASESRFRSLFENISSGVVVYRAVDDGADFVIQDFNAAAERIEGVRREEVIGKRLTVAFPGVTAFGLLEVVRRVWRTGESEKFPINLYKDARIEGWRDNYVYRLPGTEVVAAYDDVTTRMRAEQNLQESALRLELAMRASNIGSWDRDLAANEMYFSPEWKRQIGYDENEIPNRYEEWESRVHPEDLARVLTALRACVEGAVPDYAVEFRFRHKNGSYRWIMSRGAVMRDAAGKPCRILGCHVDLSRQKEAEEERARLEAQLRQAQKLESIGTLASGVAHEINNPINGVMGYAQLIKDRLDGRDGTVEEYVGEILRESGRIAGIVKNLLMFARRDPQEWSPARPVDIVQGVLSLVQTVLCGDRIDLQVDVPGDLPPVACRTQQIQQVLLNLLTNARDALNEKYPGASDEKTIRIRAGEIVKDKQSWVRMTIEDHGNGIAAELRERVFDPFFTTKPRDKGTGLGLAVSHGIVRDHRGEIWVESEVGRFTRVHVDLPAAPERPVASIQ